MTEEQETDPSEDAGETVDDLEHKGGELGEEIESAKSDWESKKESSSVPGAVPDPDAHPEPDEEAEDDG